MFRTPSNRTGLIRYVRHCDIRQTGNCVVTEDKLKTSELASPRLLYALQRQIVSTFSEADWVELSYFSGLPDLINGDPVLLPAMRAEDDTYRIRVFAILERLVEQVHPDELVRYLHLAEWLSEHEPALARELFFSGENALDELCHAAETGNIPELKRQIDRIRRTATTDPEIAIGQAKEMLETVMKAILGEHGPNSDIDIIKLVKLTREKLGLDGGGPDTYRNRTLSNLTQLVEGINKLRNLYGTGHGRSRAGETDPAHAKLVVDSAAALCVFFLGIDREQRQR
jgi:hypothetical protein